MANRSTWVAAGITLAALTITPIAVAQARPEPSNVDSAMVATLARTLGVTPEQALARLGREASFAKAEAGLRAATGGEFGGAYLNDDATVLTVAVTSATHFARVRASARDEATTESPRPYIDVDGCRTRRARVVGGLGRPGRLLVLWRGLRAPRTIPSMHSLLAPWRDRALRFTSPLGPAEALRSVAAGIGGSSARHRITGRVTGERVRLQARTLTRNSWRPVLHARIVAAAGGGSELVGTIGTHPVVKIFTVLWLFCVAAFGTAGIVFATGPERNAGLLIPWALLAFGIALNYVGYALGRNDEKALVAWLAQRLHSSTVDI